MFQPLQQQQQLAQQAQGIRQIPISSSDASMAQSAGTIPMEQSGYVDPRNISVFEAMLAGIHKFYSSPWIGFVLYELFWCLKLSMLMLI